MASTVLPNGIIVPEKFSRDWYADLYHNWQELDNLLGGGTPKDGTLTIQKNGTTVGTFSANQATDETINISVPDVNDGTLTIQQNSVTVDTFTANSSSDKTVNIQCVDLTNNQTVGGDKEFTGTTTAHDLVPSATDTYNFGSSSVQWNNAYIKSLTINGVACGDILAHNASEFVDLTSNQTVGGEKTFSNLQTNFGRDICCYSNRKYGNNLNPTANTYQYVIFSGNTVSDGPGNNWNGGYIEQFINTSGGSRGRWFIQDTSGNTVALELWASGNDKQIRPYQDNNTILGAANRRWKGCYTNAINGINPGALSLPKNSGYIAINGYITKLDGTKNEYTPPADGWLFVGVDGCTSIDVKWVGWGFGQSQSYTTAQTAYIILPVLSGVVVEIYAVGSAVSDKSRFYSCQGNV